MGVRRPRCQAHRRQDQRCEGQHYGGPTWEAADGSKITGKQVAVAPAAAGNIRSSS